MQAAEASSATGGLQGLQGNHARYDGEGRLLTSTLNGVTTTNYYDGEGRRVRKTVVGETTSRTVEFVYGVDGELAAEYDTQASTTAGVTYPAQDHLGSTRMVFDGAGVAVRCMDYLPYGEPVPQGIGARTGNCWAAGDEPRQRFTGKEREFELSSAAMPGGLDYFGARYLSGAQGRFTSPDPHNIVLLAADNEELVAYLLQPQNWNGYKYGLNNPMLFIDPTGMKELSARDCQAMGRGCVIVALNVIVDPSTRADQKLIDAQIRSVKSFYGDANVHFVVSQVSGVAGRNTIQSDAINVLVTENVPGKVAGRAGVTDSGAALLYLDPSKVQSDTAMHEMGHHFLGHTTGWMNSVSEWSGVNEIGMIALGLNLIGDLRISGLMVMGAQNVNSKTGHFTPRRDIWEGARMFSLGGSAYRRR